MKDHLQPCCSTTTCAKSQIYRFSITTIIHQLYKNRYMQQRSQAIWVQKHLQLIIAISGQQEHEIHCLRSMVKRASISSSFSFPEDCYTRFLSIWWLPGYSFLLLPFLPFFIKLHAESGFISLDFSPRSDRLAPSLFSQTSQFNLASSSWSSCFCDQLCLSSHKVTGVSAWLHICWQLTPS